MSSVLALLLVVPLTNAPDTVSQTHVDALWEYVQTLVGHKEPPPLVYFTGEEEPPLSPQFLAYYYNHTNILRISPAVVGRDSVNSAGFPPHLAAMGYVYLVLGHEMLHYALANRVAVEEHHCLFVHEGYRDRIAEFLVQQGAVHPYLKVMREETDGCTANHGSLSSVEITPAGRAATP